MNTRDRASEILVTLSDHKEVLVLGGTGHFGERICRRLSREAGISLIVTSRNKARADALASDLRRLNAGANVRGAALDQDSASFSTDLEALDPYIVLHTAGPYQYQDYRVAKACIAAGSHYIDLADGRDFVCGFSSLDTAARKKDLLLVSGASTLPGLSAAVVDELAPKFSRIESVQMSIAPAHQTPRGRGTVAAVLSYCGSPFKTLRDGEWTTVYGWQDLRLQNYPELGKRLSAACDVPDLALLPDHLPGVKTVSFHAALEATWEQLSLWLMAWFTRLRMVRSWQRFIPFFTALSEQLIFLGSVRGGMHIRISGLSLEKQAVNYSWYMTAEENHGPEIPCTPSIVLVKKMLHGDLTLRGARPCMGMMTVDEIMAELSNFNISTETVLERDE